MTVLRRREPFLSLTRLGAIARKELLQLSRDRRSLLLAFLLPLLLLVLFGYAISWDVRDVRTAVWDGDRTPGSRALVESFTASGYFSLTTRVDDPDAVRALLDRGTVRLVLVIPPGFGADLAAGRTATVQALVDGSDANTATIALAYARAVAEGFGRRQAASGRVAVASGMAGSGSSTSGSSTSGAPGLPLVADTRVWYNQDLASRNMIVPGLVAVIMMIISAMLTSLTLAREWERGTLEQLAATPVRRVEVVLGKLLPYLAIGLVDVAATSLLGVGLFGVPFRGSIVLLAVLSFFFLLGASGLGIFISAVARSQLLATQIAMIATFLPAFLLSGFMFSIAAMPAPLRAVTYLVPARYFLVVTRGIFLKGVGWEVLRLEASLMVVFAAVGVGLAVARFHKRLG